MEALQCLISLSLGHIEQEEGLRRAPSRFPRSPGLEPGDWPRGAPLPQRQEAAAHLLGVPAICPAVPLPVSLRHDDLLPDGGLGALSPRRGAHILDRNTLVYPQYYLRRGHRDHEPHLQICCRVPD